MLKFIIGIPPITKKNHNQIIINPKTHKPMIIPSKQYIQYEKQCKNYIPKLEIPINTQINLKAIFYMPTKRKVDLVNLQEALLDVLVKYKVIEDDNSQIVYSMDGSIVAYDKENPRTEIYIEEI